MHPPHTQSNALPEPLTTAIDRVRREIPALARTTIDRYIAETSLYTGTTLPDHLYREGTHTVRSILDVCLHSVLDESIETTAMMRTVFERGTERVAEGVPLREYMRCWQGAFDVLAEQLDRELGENHQLFWIAFSRSHKTFARILREVVSAYEVHNKELTEARDRHHASTIDALFRGETRVIDDPDSVPAEPAVMLLHIQESPQELAADSEPSRSLATNRKVRAVRAHLARTLHNLWLLDIRSQHGRVLMHAPTADMTGLAEDLRQVSGAQVTIAIEEASSVEDLPRAATTAAEVLEIAVRTDRTGTITRMSDVALLHHFARQSASLPVLLQPCAALLDRPELVETIRAYLASNLDRRVTADALIVHPNTVDNRLNRVRELTGLDVHDTTGLLTLTVAATVASIGGALDLPR